MRVVGILSHGGRDDSEQQTATERSVASGRHAFLKMAKFWFRGEDRCLFKSERISVRLAEIGAPVKYLQLTNIAVAP